MYKISIPHFYYMLYEENEKSIKVDIDFRDPVIHLSTQLIKAWEPPFDKETIPEYEKKRILMNIYDYLIVKRGYNKKRVKLYK